LVSGINSGANVGINIYYSGTVAAAMEGAFLKIPSVAMSLAAEEYMDFEAAGKYCIDVLKKLLPLNTSEVININIPQLSKGTPKGTKVVPQSTGGFREHYIRQKNEQNQTVFQLAGGLHHSENCSTDITSLVEGFITITALVPDMTDHKKNVQIRKIKWENND
jgi:5'-nucleotidase